MALLEMIEADDRIKDKSTRHKMEDSHENVHNHVLKKFVVIIKFRLITIAID